MKQFFQKNKVFLTGLAGAVALALAEFADDASISYKVLGFAVLTSILAYISNQWRGQGVTITGILGTLAGVYLSSQNDPEGFTWTRFALLAVVQILAMVAPPPKPLGYEKTETIKDAKIEGQVLNDKTEKPGSFLSGSQR